MPRGQDRKFKMIQPGQQPSGFEVIQYTLYDTESIPVAGATELKFFVNIGAKNIWQTNLEQSGQLPANNKLTIQSVAIKTLLTTALYTDFETIYITNRPILRFTILNKDKMVIPMDMIGAGNGLNYVLDGNAAPVNKTTNGSPITANVFKLKVPITLVGLQSFSASIEWKLSPLTAISAITPIRVSLKGILERPQR